MHKKNLKAFLALKTKLKNNIDETPEKTENYPNKTVMEM